MKFGWIPKQFTFETSTVTIGSLPDFDDAVRAVRESCYVHEGWFCAPVKTEHDDSSETCAPVPIPWFSLPFTHRIEYRGEPAQSETLHFIVSVFGWSQGLWLQPEEWGHFYRVALEPGMLTDFVVFEKDIPRVIDFADAFWHRHKADGVAATMLGAIHWFLFSQSYYQYFERFLMQYIVLDTLYKVQASISRGSYIPHGKRAEHLANSLDVSLPSWARVDSSGRSEISEIRNNLFHEAKFGGVPIGFGFPSMDGNILLSLQAFNSRLIAALLGATGGYSRSSSETQQMHRLSID